MSARHDIRDGDVAALINTNTCTRENAVAIVTIPYAVSGYYYDTAFSLNVEHVCYVYRLIARRMLL